MGKDSRIEWTHHTFNPWIGCVKVSEGCRFCYAEGMSKRTGKAKWGPLGQGTRTMTGADYWRQPMLWNAECKRLGVRERVFCASMSDVFEAWPGPMRSGGSDKQVLKRDDGQALLMDDVRQSLVELIEATQWLDWLLVTKRPQNVRPMWPNPRIGATSIMPRNVWVLASIEDDKSAAQRVPILCGVPAAVRGLSFEPMLGQVRMRALLDPLCVERMPQIDWVIIGVESRGSRVGRLDLTGHWKERTWLDVAEETVEACRELGVKCFVKQIPHDGMVLHRHPDGAWPDAWPQNLRVQDLPASPALMPALA